MAVTDKTRIWCKEQSQIFDTLYNNTGSNQAPELDDYEKSIFLTKAQDEIVKNHFTAVSNPKGQGFDDNFKRQSEFAPLMDTVNLQPITDESTLKNIQKIDQRSIIYIFPADYFLSVNEELNETVSTMPESNTHELDPLNPSNNHDTLPGQVSPKSIGQSSISQRKVLYQYIVNPIRYSEYKRQMLKPYQYPVKRTAWRLFNGTVDITAPTSTDETREETRLVVEIIGNFHTDNPKYQLRYVKKPKPIILVDLTSEQYKELDLKINGETQQTMCELGADAFHEVMQRAVELAKNSWEGNIETTKALGERSE